MKSISIGVDLGGTHTDYGVVTQEGKILSRGRMMTAEAASLGQWISSLSQSVRHVVSELGEKFVVQGIGLGAPSANALRGTIENAPNLPWRGVLDLKRRMEDHFSLPVEVDNDANAAALGEMQYGAARGVADFILITLGTGLGSGWVVDGSLLRGSTGFAGELGHILVEKEGRLCGCGRRGCLEAYVSVRGLLKTVEEKLRESREPSVLRNLSDRELTAEKVTDAALSGDRLALEGYEFTGNLLGAALANAVSITSPEFIIFFGGLAKAGDLLFEPARKSMEKNLHPNFRGTVRCVPSALGENAALLGAASMVWKGVS